MIDWNNQKELCFALFLIHLFILVPTSTTPNTPGEKKLPLTGEKLLPVAADKLPEQPLPAAADSTQQPQEQHNQNGEILNLNSA